MNPVSSRLFLILTFAGIIAIPALVQTVVESAHHEWPRAFEILKQWPAARSLRAYDAEMENSSVTARALRPWIQAFQFFGLRQAGEKALVGREGWLFYRPSVAYLTQRPRPEDSTGAEAIAAIVAFRDALAARGIRLLVLPAPNKESIYPDQLSRFAVAPKEIPSPETRAFLETCQERGIEIVDLFSIYQRARERSGPPLYLAQDSHWSPEGAALAAAAVAERICLKPKISFEARTTRLDRRGDIVRMFRSPPIERALAPESIVCQQVFQQDTGAPYTDDPQSDVLVLGDSFLRIYQQDQPGNAGFIARLALAVERPLASIVNDGGGSTLVRQELVRRPQLLGNARVVVWEFAERDLRLGAEGWQIVPLPPKGTEAVTMNR